MNPAGVLRITASAALACVLLSGTFAQEPSAEITPEEEKRIEEILALKSRLDELEADLSPAARAELERRRQAAGEESPAAEPPSSELPPPPPAAPELEPQSEPDPEPELAKPRPREPRCNTLAVFDDNQDGRVDAADRAWRFLYLWVDENGDGRTQEKEIRSAFERKVRELRTSVETYLRADGSVGDVRVEEHILLELPRSRRRSESAALMIDASDLARAESWVLVDAAGAVVVGVQAFVGGWSLRRSSGETVVLTCPRVGRRYPARR